MFSKFCRWYAKFCFGACELALTSMLLIVVFEVVRRYVFNNPTQSSLEITEYLLVSIGILPLAGILKQGRHVNVDTITTRLSPNTQIFLKFLCNIITSVFGFVIFYFGATMAIDAFVNDARSSSLLAFPLGVAYGIIPIGFLSLGLTALDLGLQDLKRLGQATGGDHE